MELFAKIVHCIQPLTIFAKHFKLFVSQGYEYASDKTKQNTGVLSFISQKIKTAISANLFLNSFLSSHCPCQKFVQINNAQNLGSGFI